MFKLIVALIVLSLPITAKAQSNEMLLPPGYTAISFKYVEYLADITKMQEIWRDKLQDIPPELRDKTDFFASRVNRGNGRYDIVTMVSSPYLCGVQRCPLRIVTQERGKFKTLLDTNSVFALEDDVYNIGPMKDGENRNFLIRYPDEIMIYSYDDKKEEYVREEK